MYPTSDENLNRETEEAVYFFTPAFHPLDTFSAHIIELWGQKFPTAEHAYQWKKFNKIRPDLAEQVLLAPSPEAAKQISENNRIELPAEWSQNKAAAMEEILTAKANQNADVREILQKTGTRQIIENSPVDSFWGCGPNGDGQNMMGKIWMRIRDSL